MPRLRVTPEIMRNTCLITEWGICVEAGCTRTHQTLNATREVAIRFVASEKLNTRPFQSVSVFWKALWISCPLAKWYVWPMPLTDPEL